MCLCVSIQQETLLSVVIIWNWENIESKQENSLEEGENRAQNTQK